MRGSELLLGRCCRFLVWNLRRAYSEAGEVVGVFSGLSSAVMTMGEIYAVDAPKCVPCFSLAGRVSGLLPEPRCVTSMNNTSSQM